MLGDNLIGRSLKDFVIRERIGRGGMASVYRAHQPAVRRDVAIKVINLGGDHYDDQFQERFAREAELIAHLEHIHILPIYDYGVVDGMAFIAMRLLAGGTLHDLIAQKSLTPDRAIDLFAQVADGLDFAHSRGVIHRDLKPANILLDVVGNAYIADFGLAKLLGSSLELTDNDNIVGTPHYMSPEQIRGETLTPLSDMYSLGVLLYQMLCGNLPYKDTGQGLVSSIYQSLEKDPIPPREWKPDISQSLERAILKAISKKPEARFQTANQMARTVNRAMGRPSDIHLRQADDSPSTISLARQSPIAVLQRRPYTLAMGGVVLVVVAALVWMLLGGGDNTIEFGPPIVLENETAAAADIIPSSDEISRAQERLGPDGFLGVMACNTSSQYHATQTREIADFARAYGLAVRIYDPDSDGYEQITQLERARAQGADGLFICALDFELLNASLSATQTAGVPMVFLQSDTPDYGVRISSDNYLMGTVPGRYAGQLITDELGGQARVITLDYPDLDDLVIRADGLEEGLLEVAPDAEIVGRYLGGTRENAEESVSTLLNDGITFDVILSINDAGSYGAIAALEDVGYQGDEVIIVSVDAEDLAKQFIQSEYFIRGSVSVGRTEAAQGAVDAMVKLLAGSSVEADIRTEPGVLITRETLVNEED